MFVFYKDCASEINEQISSLEQYPIFSSDIFEWEEGCPSFKSSNSYGFAKFVADECI